MSRGIAFFLFMFIGFTVNAQIINVRGTVSNSTGKPIASATVKLAGKNLSATTKSTGAYSITKTGVLELHALPAQPAQISLNSGILEIGLANPSPVFVEIFDVQGNLLKKEFKPNVPAGVYHLNILQNTMATNLLVIKATIGNQVAAFRCMPLNYGKYTVTQSAIPVSARLTKTAAAAVGRYAGASLMKVF